MCDCSVAHLEKTDGLECKQAYRIFSIKHLGRLFKTTPRRPGVSLTQRLFGAQRFIFDRLGFLVFDTLRSLKS